MFKLDASESYTWPVTVERPEDGGRTSKYTFDATFKRITTDESTDIMRRFADSSINDATLVREVLVGWKGIGDKNGDEVPFSEDALTKAINILGFPRGVVLAWIESVSPKGKQKN